MVFAVFDQSLLTLLINCCFYKKMVHAWLSSYIPLVDCFELGYGVTVELIIALFFVRFYLQHCRWKAGFHSCCLTRVNYNYASR